MTFSQSLLELKRIPLNIDKSFYVVLVLLPFANILFNGWGLGLTSFLILPFVFLFALLHEYGHCWAAIMSGYRVRGIKLWFLGGLATIECVNNLPPKQEIFISALGPATNFLLMIPFIFLSCIFGINPLFSAAVAINLVLGVFNLIPAFPMDGGRILRAILHYYTGNMRDGTILAAKAGILISGLMILLGSITANFMLVMIFGWVGMICYSTIQDPGSIA